MMGSGLLPLAVAAALVTGSVLFIAEQSQPQLQCPLGPSWRQQAALAAHMPASPPGAAPQEAGDPAVMDFNTASVLTGLAADAMRRVGWPLGTKFARFDESASLLGVMSNPWRHMGSFLLITPGNGTLSRRLEHVPFLSIDPTATNLTAVLSPGTAALNLAAGALEAALGRRLFAFRLETAPLPACASGNGPCAVWEASSGRVVLDSWLAGKMAAMTGWGPAAAAAGEFVEGGEEMGGGSSGSGGSGGGREPLLQQGVEHSGLPGLLAAFVKKLGEQAVEAAELLKSGTASLPALASSFARAGTSAVLLLMAGPTPLWWCIACPIVLGMLAPFLFNFGLTYAAETLCAQLQLPDDACTDLW